MNLQITDVSKVFPTDRGEVVEALAHINMTVNDGEFLCILGPSGCGKTTLLRIIAGLEPPTTGSIQINGSPILGPTAKMAMIFQEYSLFPWRTVTDNISFGLEIRGMPNEERDKVAREFLDLVGLSGFEQRYPYELSGGMRQRVAVARALAIDPAVLLMDEPFGALDAQTRNRMQKELLQIHEKTQKTIVFVTHSVDEAVYLADRVAILTKRPGTIKEIVKVIHCRPRDRTCTEFATTRKYILDLITEESTAIQ